MSNTRETISLKTIIMTQNMTKRQGKRKGKGKDTCDAFFPLSLSTLVSLSSVLEDERKKKEEKKKSEEKRRAILVSV
jgi:hypothetical protein|tara:strand:- start:186 stop:416 length:231 start_codon:yes stop_codon:yes gene_type:complete